MGVGLQTGRGGTGRRGGKVRRGRRPWRPRRWIRIRTRGRSDGRAWRLHREADRQRQNVHTANRRQARSEGAIVGQSGGDAMKSVIATTFSATLVAAALVCASAPPDDVDAQVDRLFSQWNTPSTPGCAVGAAIGGQPVLAKAYGMADLEHDVRNTPDTIFEAGSVSKQFTAAAVLLLAREGKLSLDDPVR